MIRKILLFIALNCMVITASANPEGGVVTSGDATITQTPGYTEINQSSSQAILDWRSFNIGANEHTHFQQPTGGVALNRIDPTQGASQIFGQLTATGRIILINQAGIFFGPGAKVDVVGIVASTSDMTNANFLAGKYIFDQPSNYNGAIINQGTIRAAEYGLVGLVGAGVSNEGTITAHLGSVVLASGNKFTVDMYGDQMINFSIDEGTHHQAVDQNGQPLRNAVNNSGTIVADGGRVIMSARAAASVLDNVINMSGIVQAKSVSQKNGVIILDGGNKGIVKVSGKMYASGRSAGQRGGKVRVTGQQVIVQDQAAIDVAGNVGGGEILLGGNYQGLGPEQNALYTFVGSDVQLNADALSSGNGGRIIAWADDVTQFYGSVSAKGGALSGDGGFVETSGHYLDVQGAKINLSAPNGVVGNWLLDPTDLSIVSSPGTTTNVTTSGSPIDTYTGNNGSNTSSILNTDLQEALVNSNVTVLTTSNGAGSGTGKITIAATITWSSDNKLTLTSIDTIFQNAGSIITNTTLAGALEMNATNGITLNANINTIGAHDYKNAVTIGTALTLTGTTFAFASTIGLNANLTLANSASSTINTVISGAGGLTKAGSGTLTLSGGNSYTGGTIINAGTLSLESLTGLGDPSGASLVTVSTGGILDLSNYPATIGSYEFTIPVDKEITLSGGELLNNGGNFLTILGDGKVNLAQSSSINVGTDKFIGIVSDIIGNGGLTKTGAGELAFGSANNTYVGTTTINGGILALSSYDNLIFGSINSNNIIIGSAGQFGIDSVYGTDITLSNSISGSGGFLNASSYIVTLTNNNNTFTGNVSVLDGTLQLGNGATTGEIGSGNIVLGSVANNTRGILAINRSNAITLANTITGLGDLTQSGSGTATLTSADNAYTGTTTISGGTLQIGAGTTGSIGVGNIVNNSALVFNRNNSLNLSSVISGSGSLTQAGTGSLILTGTNTYQGITTINPDSTLQLGAAGVSGSIGSGNIVNNGTLTFNRTNSLTIANAISGTGRLVQNGTGTTAISGGNSYSGGTSIDAGTLSLENQNGLGLPSAESLAQVNTGGTLDFTNLTSDYTIGSGKKLFLNGGELARSNDGDFDIKGAGTIELLQSSSFNSGSDGAYFTNFSISSVITGSGGLIKTGGGNLFLTNANTYSGTTAINEGSFYLTNNTVNATHGTINNTSEVVINSGGALGIFYEDNYDSTFSIPISGAGIFAKLNSNVTTITNDNSGFTGTVYLWGGTLQLGGGGTSGGLGSSSIGFGSGQDPATWSVLAINRSDTATFTNTITGDGHLLKNGAGTAILTSTDNAYTGNTTISGGILQIGNGGANGSIGSGNIINNATLAINSSNSLSIASAISGTGLLTKSGTGTLAISGDNSYAGGTTIYAGTLSLVSETGLGSPAALNSNLVTVNTGGTLDFSNYNVDYFTIPSSKEIILNGGVLSSTAKYAFLIGAGEIRLSQTSTINATDNGEFGGGFAVYNKIVGTGGLVKTGSANLYLENSNTYQGATSVNEGYLVLSRSATYVPGGSIGSSAVTIESSGHFGVEYGFNYTDISLSNSISGSGEFYVDGENTVTLTNNNNTFTGAVNVYYGTLNITNAGALGSGQVTVESGAALGLPNTLSAGVNNAIKLNGGTLNNTGVNILAGVITLGNGTSSQMVNGGTLMINNAINNAGNLSISGVGDVVLNGIVGGVTPLQSLSISQNATINSGAVTTTGNQSYTSLVALGQNTTFTTGSNGGISLTGGLFDTGAARTLTLVGNSDNTFAFGGTVAGNNTITVNGGTGFNTLDFSLYASPVYLTLASSNDGGVADVGGMTFNNINNSIGTGLNSTLDAINVANAKVYYITPTHGYIADPFYFTNYTVVNARVVGLTPSAAETSLAPLQNLNATLTAQTTSYLQFPESAIWSDEQDAPVTIVNTPTLQYTCEGASGGGVCTGLTLKSVFDLQLSSNQ